MRVTVEFVAYLTDLVQPKPAGEPSELHGTTLVVTVKPGTTVDGLLRLLADRHPDFSAVAYHEGRFAGSFQVLVGERLLELAGGWDRVLADGDELVLLPPFSGG